MSKTRTGRKGRARLAVAGHLDATGQGRTDADNLTETQLLERLGGFATGDGASGAYFSNGEEVGAILDDICEKSGIYSDDETAGGSPLSANVDGEESLAASGDLPQLSGGPFRHYYIKAKDTAKADALTAARATGVQATETHGIAYLQSGPGAKFIPSNHGLQQNDFVAFSVSPDFDAVKESDYTKMTYVMLGNVSGHTVEGAITQHAQASASFKISGASSILSGDEFRIIGREDEILLKIIGSDSGENGVNDGQVGDLVRYTIDGNSIFILRVDGGGISDTDAASGMADAINEWAGQNAKDLNASSTDETVTVTMQKYQGTSGNNSDDSALASLTITALKKQGANPDSLVPLDVNELDEQWFTDTGDTAVAHVVFENGDSTSTPFSANGATTSFKVEGGADFINEDNKFVNTELELTVEIGADPDAVVSGLALAWSLSE